MSADPTADFFSGVAQQRTHLLPVGLTGTIRFDLRRGRRVDHWYVSFAAGQLQVEHIDDERDAECVVCADGAAFDNLVAGANPAAAVLRNEVSFRGRLQIFVLFQRLLPGPRGDTGPQRAVTGGVVTEQGVAAQAAVGRAGR
ncbi:SCP2 sterol-binding domain-containing protein [Micromonospora sp. NBC_01813]|uniref:SCP2 sterol-binding domain-containing protein n=1 Tax=Micromonospora sp. NBC_01813 TaxID=2975988 RepID=UPI002DDBF46F|nr:SCP2 sterol-binding domain-containing protein [Micromonospora sp. NBC_01813]WSA10027.1 SCP2 sterol-binding domain-containing protein [Micromonospora sp. NBC_01813]